MIEVSENIILGSIIYQLKEYFGECYKYYDEQIDERFDRPSFHVSRITGINNKQYTSNNLRFENNSYRYQIRYFPKQSSSINKDINEKIDILKGLFHYLNLVNIEEEITYKPNRINQIEYVVNDGVLLFDLLFDIRVVECYNLPKVKENILNENIKKNI